jgi:hypothetical protein
MTPLDYFRHDFPPFRLQWPLASAGQEPHAFIIAAAVKDMDAVACHCVMERGARVFGDESEERLPPRIVDVMEDLFAELLELFNADCSNRFRDGFAALFIKALKVEFFEWHKKCRAYFSGAPVPWKSPPSARYRFTRSRRREARTCVNCTFAARFSPARRNVVNMSIWPC